jgi:S-adenosylmethionine:tRNA ribosyltransferase-isomerase
VESSETSTFKTSDFDYILPGELIAQTPIEPRDSSRLLVVDRRENCLSHRCFNDLPSYLKAGDVLVFNNSRVIRARLFATRLDTRQKMEILLLRRLEANTWEALTGSRKKVQAGLTMELLKDSRVKARVTELKEGGIRVLRFSDDSTLPQLGEMPLPPYIHEPLLDPERYQTVYSEEEGSVAAPTAGLHFTPGLLEKIQKMGVHCLFVTLHVGLNTFRPVKEEDILAHPVYPEYGVITEAVAGEINAARQAGRRVICVGTTSVRLLESVAQAHPGDALRPHEGWVNLFIRPGYRFTVTDALITNFHLPKSTLLMLVSAFAGRDLILRAYEEAIRLRYRFYSFGDAMLVL